MTAQTDTCGITQNGTEQVPFTLAVESPSSINAAYSQLLAAQSTVLTSVSFA